MKKLSKERLLYWVKTKISIINIKEGIVPTDEEVQAYRQICNLINSYFLIVNLKSPGYGAGYEQGLFDEKMNQQKGKEDKEMQLKEALDHLDNIVETYVDKKVFVGDEPFVYGRAKDAIELLRFNFEKGKCEHDWYDITVHDEKHGKTYKCSKCPEEKFEPNENVKKIKSASHDIFKTFSLGILYEKLLATPAVEIKKLVMKEVKEELEQLEKKKVNK